jgi:hypothetical protein
MIFCGQCGYQLSPGENVCPRCGAQTNAELIEDDPGIYNLTEVSHTLSNPPQRSQVAAPQNRNSQPGIPIRSVPPKAEEPLILGANSLNEQLANETTTVMNSQMYPPAYPNYPQPVGMGFQGYNTGIYAQYQDAQALAVARLLAASQRGKMVALLLILFGLLLLTGAVVTLLLTLQGIIFTS